MTNALFNGLLLGVMQFLAIYGYALEWYSRESNGYFWISALCGASLFSLTFYQYKRKNAGSLNLKQALSVAMVVSGTALIAIVFFGWLFFPASLYTTDDGAGSILGVLLQIGMNTLFINTVIGGTGVLAFRSRQ